MKNWIILLTAFLFGSQAFATAAGTRFTEGEATCIECMGGGVSPSDALMRFARNMSEISNGLISLAPTVASTIANPRVYSPDCRAFAANGKYGPLGRSVIEEVNRPENRALYAGSSDLHRLCPNYKSMSKEEKDGMWVLFAAGWAEQESSCKPRSRKVCENGDCNGIIQLHMGKEDEYNTRNGRNLCQRGDSNRPDTSFRCGLSMLNKNIEAGKRLFDRKSHFGTLLPDGSQGSGLIMNSIRRYPPCGETSLVQNNSAKRNTNNRVAQQ